MLSLLLLDVEHRWFPNQSTYKCWNDHIILDLLELSITVHKQYKVLVLAANGCSASWNSSSLYALCRVYMCGLKYLKGVGQAWATIWLLTGGISFRKSFCSNIIPWNYLAYGAEVVYLTNILSALQNLWQQLQQQQKVYLYCVQTHVCMSLRTLRTRHKQVHFVKWLPGHWWDLSRVSGDICSW